MIDASGGCHCGAIRYRVVADAPKHSALCHCTDCRRVSGSPTVAWAAFAEDQVTLLSGTPVVYESSEYGRRAFCGTCGTGLFYTNAEILPGITDIQTATLDDPAMVPPAAHIQDADAIDWMRQSHDLPRFDRWPG